MIKKIQQYLLLNYPTLWNIRLVPMLLILLITHLVIFGIGYLVTDTTFTKTYYYSPSNTLGLLYPISILVGILLFIGWFIFYNRNNGFKTFYPRKIKQVYAEWILAFIILSAITFIPFTLTQGFLFKWKSVATLAEADKAMEDIQKAKILIPSSVSSYTYDDAYSKPISIPENMRLNYDTLNLSLYEVEYNSQSGVILKGYTGASLLFYKDYNSYYFYNNEEEYLDSLSRVRTKKEEIIKTWLKNGYTDSIYVVMKKFSALQEKHNLSTNLSIEEWYKRIYNPPFFPVNESTMIIDYNRPNDYDYDYDYNNIESVVETTDETVKGVPSMNQIEILPTTLPYLQYSELETGYNQIIKSYNNPDTLLIILFCLYFALGISILIFSYRSTNGKSWLIALITAGVLIFISTLLAIGLGEVLSSHHKISAIIILFFWIALFITLLIKISIKVINKKNKGWSNIYINILIWLMPCILPFTFLVYVVFREINDYYYYSGDDDMLNIMWINIPVAIAAMFAIAALTRNWKSIPEE